MSNETFVERMTDEHDELCDRLDKLDRFISDSEVYQMLTGDEKSDLQEQRRAMERYRTILGRRISRYIDF